MARQNLRVPEWSGVLWPSPDGQVAYQSIYVGDTRTHASPKGWRVVRSYFDLEDDAEVFIYERVSR